MMMSFSGLSRSESSAGSHALAAITSAASAAIMSGFNRPISEALTMTIHCHSAARGVPDPRRHLAIRPCSPATSIGWPLPGSRGVPVSSRSSHSGSAPDRLSQLGAGIGLLFAWLSGEYGGAAWLAVLTLIATFPAQMERRRKRPAQPVGLAPHCLTAARASAAPEASRGVGQPGGDPRVTPHPRSQGHGRPRSPAAATPHRMDARFPAA